MGLFGISQEELENVPEPDVYRGDEPVEFEIVEIKKGTCKKQNPSDKERPWVMMTCKIYGDDEGLYLPFKEFVPTVDPNQSDPEKRQWSALKVKRFLHCLGIEDVEDWNELIGLGGVAKLKIEISDQYGEQNKVARWIPAD